MYVEHDKGSCQRKCKHDLKITDTKDNKRHTSHNNSFWDVYK